MHVLNDFIKKSDFYSEFRVKNAVFSSESEFPFLPTAMVVQNRQSYPKLAGIDFKTIKTRIKQNVIISEQKTFNSVRVT